MHLVYILRQVVTVPFCHWLGSDLTVSQLLVLKELVQGKFGKGEVLGIQWGLYANKRFASLGRLNRGDLWKEHWPLADQLPLMGQEECVSHMDTPLSRGHMVGLLCQACASLEFHTLLASLSCWNPPQYWPYQRNHMLTSLDGLIGMSGDMASLGSASESCWELHLFAISTITGPSPEESSQVSISVSHRKQKHSKGEAKEGNGMPGRSLRKVEVKAKVDFLKRA